MKFIKVCGMTDKENIEALCTIDAINLMGLIFYPKSKRYVTTNYQNTKSKESIGRVGVFVNETKESILKTVKAYELDYVQLHGSETSEFCSELTPHTKVIKAFGIDETFYFPITKSYEGVVELFLFDTKTKSHGGSGKQFQWDLLKKYKGATPFLLSGGISLKHAQEVNAFEHPAFVGVDLNSGFECMPGLKNVDEIKEFIEKLK